MEGVGYDYLFRCKMEGKVEKEKIDILLSEEEKTIFNLGDKKYFIGKLSSGQVLRIVKYVVNISGKVTELKKQFIDNKNSNDMQDILAIVEILDDDQIANVEAILLDEPDKDFIKTNLNFEKLVELLSMVLENNDIKTILKNAKRLKIAIQKAI